MPVGPKSPSDYVVLNLSAGAFVRRSPTSAGARYVVFDEAIRTVSSAFPAVDRALPHADWD